MKCVAIDDEPFALELIEDYIRRTPFLEHLQSFSNPYKALDFINRGQVDLVFLDINMPELSGMQLIRSLNSPPMVVFTTAYPEFAAESYEFNAVDYLVKPVRYERFLKAVNKASVRMGQKEHGSAEPVTTDQPRKQESFFIKSGHQQVKLHPDEILFVEAAGNYMCFHTREKKIMSLLSMKDALEMLHPDLFVRVHKSWIVARKHIDAIDRHEITVAGQKIPIGITYREHFFKVMGL